jgi:hypothetical protein
MSPDAMRDPLGQLVTDDGLEKNIKILVMSGI